MSSCCEKSGIGLTLDEVYGWGLGSETGIYTWPYAACSGKISQSGIFVPLKSEESLRICKEYCKAQKKLGSDKPSQSFKQISRTDAAVTCEEQCDLVMQKIGRKENFELYSEKKCTTPYWIIPVLIVVTIIGCILLLRK